MGMTVWILFCFFACVGLVQCGIWLAEMFKTPRAPLFGYYVLPLYDDAEKLEAEIRLELSRVQSLQAQGASILLVDMGMMEESREICENLMQDIYGVYLCEKDEVAETIERLDTIQSGQDLQIPPDDVE